ncbi:unnamed protein product [Angiostrongylus costaricensis]|uniref:SCP domain-containing protein n=1 Tax=Angiostrongylus costaricensis TaxID=334426 RepID=A0A0R3Q2F4_ANGCS|nr:unnamed protein product [Angiostrongylus costaricensis]
MLRTTYRALERYLLKYDRHSQYLAGMRNSDHRNLSHLRNPREYTSTAKQRWAGHIMRRVDDRWTKRTVEWAPRECKRRLGRPPTRCADVFVNKVNQLYQQLPFFYRSRHESRTRYHSGTKPPP